MMNSANYTNILWCFLDMNCPLISWHILKIRTKFKGVICFRLLKASKQIIIQLVIQINDNIINVKVGVERISQKTEQQTCSKCIWDCKTQSELTALNLQLTENVQKLHAQRHNIFTQQLQAETCSHRWCIDMIFLSIRSHSQVMQNYIISTRLQYHHKKAEKQLTFCFFPAGLSFDALPLPPVCNTYL